jgi:hypothetical protein
MLPSTDNQALRQLVQQLMLHGWYRLGQGPRNDQGRKTWGFCEGHLLDTSREHTCWVVAQDELSAMQTLLEMLDDVMGVRSKRRVTVHGDTVADDHQPDRHHAGRVTESAISRTVRS